MRKRAALSSLFRRLFVEQLQTAVETHRLAFLSTLASFVYPSAFARRQATLRQIDWVVYAKRRKSAWGKYLYQMR